MGQDVTHGEGEVLATKHVRNPGGKKRFNSAMVAILADRYVEEAVEQIAEIMRTGDRSSDRLRAASALVELALERDVTAGAMGGDVTRIYVLAEAPGAISAAVDEARRRRALPVGGK
jgi:hypothetical protein